MANWLIDDTLSDDDLMEGIGRAPSTVRDAAPVALRLNDIVVKDNRKWFGGADINLQTFVIHGGPPDEEGQVPIHTATQEFPRVSDNGRLSTDRFMAFHGVPKHFLDFAVVLVRNRADSVEAAQVVQDVLADERAATATDALTAMLTAANPNELAIAAAVRGALLITDLTLSVLKRNGTEAVGLYRTTWLASENFGIGEPHVQDEARFSFSYEVLTNPV